jgi:cyclophilin family peptidyl-prolyl cis-trans isomerase/HEAT repeat protein
MYACNTKTDTSTYQKIKEFEFSRNSDTTYYANVIASGDKNKISLVIESIGKIGNDSFLPLLQELISSDDYEIQKEVVFALGQIGTSACEDLLINIFNNQNYSNLKNDIVYALGRCAGKKSSSFLLKNFRTFNDSLKASTIINLSFIFKRDIKLKSIPDSINTYLNNNSNIVRGAAVYFFHRNEYLPAFYNLINTNMSSASIDFKYKLSAISKVITKNSPDTLMLDSLKITLLNKKFYTEPDWKKLLYKIKILSYYPDSLITEKISSYLQDENPHVRKEAIIGLGKTKSDYSKNILLHYYDQAGWTEKGIIILNLAERYPKFIYRLIQQNLDQGTIYFKEMLLQSLAKINDKMSRTQLKQFLNVPEPRLQAVAFEELDKLHRLSYADVKPLLLSGNNMLTSYATSWVAEHSKYTNYEDLKAAYKKFSDPNDSEVLISLLEVINSLKLSKSAAFLDSIYLTTSHPDIAKTAATGISNLDVKIEKRDFSDFSLFVPDSIIYQSNPINITINTQKGDIGVELWPADCPLTVSNIIYLIRKNYYKNLIFHRVVSDFVIQGGDPTGTGWGGPGYSIPCEYNDNPFVRGSIGMATSGKDTGGSQFFICHSEQPHLNRRYTNFGIVKSGLEVVDKITKDDKILNIIIN